MNHRQGFGALAAAAAALWIGQAAAQAPAGMIMEVSGATEPKVESLTEVEPGFAVKLAPGAKLGFVHYKSCKTVTVEGGQVAMRLTDYTVTEGKIVSEAKRCPKRFALAAGGSTEAGGMVLRGPPKLIATRPVVLLTGPAATGFGAAELRQDDKVVANLTLSGRRASLPDGAAALQPGQQYMLVLLPKAGGKPVSEKFTADPAADPALVLSLE